MNKAAAIHNAARHYCASRQSLWQSRYADLEKAGKSRAAACAGLNRDYSDDAYDLFPRYLLDEAIQQEIERLSPEQIASDEEILRLLAVAAQHAGEDLDDALTNALARKALRDEREAFQQFLAAVCLEELSDAPTLPSRRVLSAEESAQVWRAAWERWGIEDGLWYPVDGLTPPPHTVVFHVTLFTERDGSRLLRQALSEQGITRVYELHEFDPCVHELEIALLEPCKPAGGARFYLSHDGDWLVYASHAQSITLSGERIAVQFQAAWPDWAEKAYAGPAQPCELRRSWAS